MKPEPRDVKEGQVWASRCTGVEIEVTSVMCVYGPIRIGWRALPDMSSHGATSIGGLRRRYRYVRG